MEALAKGWAEAVHELRRPERVRWLALGGHIVRRPGRHRWRAALSPREIAISREQVARYRGEDAGAT